MHLISGEMDWSTTEAVTKPILLGSLFIYFLGIQRSIGRNKFSIFISIALIFCLLGDVFLMFQNVSSTYFIFGLGAFLIGHLFYIFAFHRTYRQDHEIALIKRHGWVMVIIVAYGYLFFNRIKGNLHDLIGPVMVYTMVICLMLLIAVNRFKRVSMPSFISIFLGALLFVISDSILAWNKFVLPFDYAHLLIMLTYGLAQVLIVNGSILQLRDQKRDR